MPLSMLTGNTSTDACGGGGHRPGLAADHQGVALAAGGEVGLQCEGGDGLAGGEFGQDLGVGSWAAISALAMTDGT